VAERFVVDIDKAQQVGERLAAIGRTIAGFPPLPQPSGPLGTGVLERAWSDFESKYATAKQGSARDITGSARSFAALASDVINNDQQHAQQARGIGANR